MPAAAIGCSDGVDGLNSSAASTSTFATSAVDMRRVADLVRKLAEARYQVRQMQEVLKERDVEIEALRFEKRQQHRVIETQYAAVSSVRHHRRPSSRSSSSSLSNRSSSSSHRYKEAQRNHTCRATRPSDQRGTSSARAERKKGSVATLEKKSHHTHRTPEKGRHRYAHTHTKDAWKRRYMRLRTHHEMEIAQRDVELGEIQVLINEIAVAQDHARLQHEQSNLHSRIQQSLVLPWAAEFPTQQLDLGVTMKAPTISPPGFTALPVASAAAASDLPSAPAPTTGLNTLTGDVSPVAHHLCPQTHGAADHTTATAAPTAAVSANLSWAVDAAEVAQLRREVDRWKDQCLSLLLGNSSRAVAPAIEKQVGRPTPDDSVAVASNLADPPPRPLSPPTPQRSPVPQHGQALPHAEAALAQSHPPPPPPPLPVAAGGTSHPSTPQLCAVPSTTGCSPPFPPSPSLFLSGGAGRYYGEATLMSYGRPPILAGASQHPLFTACAPLGPPPPSRPPVLASAPLPDIVIPTVVRPVAAAGPVRQSHAAVDASASVGPPSGRSLEPTRDALDRRIARHDKLLSAIAKLQQKASEHTSRVPH